MADKFGVWQVSFNEATGPVRRASQTRDSDVPVLWRSYESGHSTSLSVLV